MSTQPEALQYAAYLESRHEYESAAELRRLHRGDMSLQQWLDKTEWIQETAQPRELGMHRADVLRQRIERLHAQRQALLEALQIIAGQKQCVDNLMSDKDIARAAIKAAEEQA